jgi:hypothetical protein
MKEETQYSSRLVKWSLIIGIVIVMNLFFNYAISLVYKAPDYDIYFPSSQVVPVIVTQADCIAVGGQWNSGYCNQEYTKQLQYDAAQKNYDRVVFIALVILGVLSIVAGTIFENEVLSLAFSWGGVFSLFIASLRYWSDANNFLKVIILAIALGSLIWTAIKKFA